MKVQRLRCGAFVLVFPNGQYEGACGRVDHVPQAILYSSREEAENALWFYLPIAGFPGYVSVAKFFGSL